MTISVQVEYNGAKGEVLLKHPTRMQRRQYILKLKAVQKVKDNEDETADALLSFYDFREELMLGLIISAPFIISKEALDELPLPELNKLVHAVIEEINMNPDFRVPSGGQPPTGAEGS